LEGIILKIKDKLKDISASIPKKLDQVETEEATKNAFVLPFIKALGYDVFDPHEVIPEFTADVGTKKGERVDYAIIRDGKPVILIECKSCNRDLDKEHASQLYRYFSVTEAKFGVLTNGINYRFYTDLEEQNKMDSKSFFEIDLNNLKDYSVKELNKFSKSSFDVDHIFESASELKYLKEMKKIMLEQLENPSDEFVRFLAKRVYSGLLHQKVREQFTEITKKALNQFIKEQVDERLESALGVSEESDSQEEKFDLESKDKEIITTEDEWEGYYIVRAILHEIVDIDRVAMRDTRSYCGILLDDNNRKPICRLHFDGKQKYITVFDEFKKEAKIPIEHTKDLYKHGEKFKKTVKNYDNKK